MGRTGVKGSTRRTMPSAYHHKQKRGPNGERLCRWCEQPVEPPRRTYCSDECVHEWLIRTDPAYLRQRVFKRDRGVCALCGRDTEALRKELSRLRWRDRRNRMMELGLPPHRQTFWDADHIVPVVEGGGECGLDNIRTLCWWCHRDETKKLRRRLSGKPEQLRLVHP